VSFLPRAVSPRVFGVVLLLGVGAAIPLLLFSNPSVDGFFPPCFFYKLTDFYCPGCGATRACDSLVEGKIIKAFGFNPLFVACFPLAAYFILRSAWAGIALNKEYQINEKYSSWLVGLGILTIVYGVIRNIPIEVFSWMRPG
jgi:hypothetical protein